MALNSHNSKNTCGTDVAKSENTAMGGKWNMTNNDQINIQVNSLGSA